MLTIGEISYLNCTPIFVMLRSRFADAGYRYVPGAPAELNQLLRTGELDVCPSSSIEYARHPDSYLILPRISIASVGAVKSVLLFLPCPIEELDGAEIALTGESETSVALLKILLARRYSFTNSFRAVTVQEQESLPENVPLLLIGDSALRGAMNAGKRRVYDLGKLWFEFTGLPFVFALWLARRSTLVNNGAALRLFVERLMCSKQLSGANFGEIAAVAMKKHWKNREFLYDYWKSISYELDGPHLEGLKCFFRFAVECGILEREPDVSLLESREFYG